MENTNMPNDVKNGPSWWQRFVAGLNEFYHAPYRQTMARAARDEEDFFMLHDKDHLSIEASKFISRDLSYFLENKIVILKLIKT